jgi:GGDEF domain-containing protein
MFGFANRPLYLIAAAHRTIRVLVLVISLKRLLAMNGDEAKSHSRVAWLLLEAIACHAVESDPEERQGFQTCLRAIATKMEKSNDEGALVLTGEAIKSIETYNRGVQQSMGSQVKELQSIVSMFMRSMLQVSKGSTASAMKLRQIERLIEKTSQAEDLRTIKAQLQESLEVLCKEAVQQERRAEEVTDQLRLAMSRPESAAVLSEVIADLDLVTGLPNFRTAEKAIREACAANTKTYLVLLCVERLDVINGRFGFSVGDQILMLFGQHLAQCFDRLYRWRGPGFLALVDRSGPEISIRAEIARTVSTRLELEIELSGRSVLLPISSSWMLTGLAQTSVEQITQKIDKFCAAQAGATLNHSDATPDSGS